MITLMDQRWRDGRASWQRPDRALFVPRLHAVARLADTRTAKAFVVQHHYTKSFPSARFRFGLYAGAALVGVAVFGVGMHANVLRPFPAEAAVELARVVLHDEVAFNAESWFVARCFEELRREGLAGVVSFSDPFPRTDADGREVFKGHIGTFYQALNGTYTGLTERRTIRLFRDGSVCSARAIAKVRSGERGWRHVVEQLVTQGAPSPTGDLRAWLPVALAATTRTERHTGNHRYLWALDRAARRLLPSGRPYPRFEGRVVS